MSVISQSACLDRDTPGAAGRKSLIQIVVALLILSALPAALAAEPSFAEEREIALWVLREGGAVITDQAPDPIRDPFNLPEGDFRIRVVDMHGTITSPKELEPLSKLRDVRELYVPARVWSPESDVKAPFSDESFDFYKDMSKLEKFHAGHTTLAWLDIGDEGVKRLAPLTQLKHLRVALTTIKDPACFEALVNLESLDLNDTYVLDESLAPLEKMTHLRRLTLVGTLITDEGLAHLRGLTELNELDLYGVKITDRGVEHLRNLKQLRRLNLLGAQVTDASLQIIAGFDRFARAQPLSQPGDKRRPRKPGEAQEASPRRSSLQQGDLGRRGNASSGAAGNENRLLRFLAEHDLGKPRRPG